MKVLRMWPLLLMALGSGCALQKVGKDLGDGLMQAVNDNSATVGQNLLKGAGEGLRNDVLNDATRGRITATVTAAGEAVIAQIPDARDQVLNDKSREQLQLILEALLKSVDEQGRRTSRGLLVEAGRGLREDVLNQKTRAELNTLLIELTNTARVQTNQMRDDMLGEATQKHVDVLVRGAMNAVVDGTERIRTQAHAELSFVQRNTAETFLVVGGVSGVVMLVLWRQREKNRLLLQLLAKQLHDMADAPNYAASVERLEQRAEQMGVRNQLEDAMLLQGMISARRRDRKKKTAS